MQMLKPRDVRKIDPAFAARLEPTVFVRAGCIIISLGRNSLQAIITREALYCVLTKGTEHVRAAAAPLPHH